MVNVHPALDVVHVANFAIGSRLYLAATLQLGNVSSPRTRPAGNSHAGWARTFHFGSRTSRRCRVAYSALRIWLCSVCRGCCCGAATRIGRSRAGVASSSDLLSSVQHEFHWLWSSYLPGWLAFEGVPPVGWAGTAGLAGGAAGLAAAGFFVSSAWANRVIENSSVKINFTDRAHQSFWL